MTQPPPTRQHLPLVTPVPRRCARDVPNTCRRGRAVTFPSTHPADSEAPQGAEPIRLVTHGDRLHEHRLGPANSRLGGPGEPQRTIFETGINNFGSWGSINPPLARARPCSLYKKLPSIELRAGPEPHRWRMVSSKSPGPLVPKRISPVRDDFVPEPHLPPCATSSPEKVSNTPLRLPACTPHARG